MEIGIGAGPRRARLRVGRRRQPARPAAAAQPGGLAGCLRSQGPNGLLDRTSAAAARVLAHNLCVSVIEACTTALRAVARARSLFGGDAAVPPATAQALAAAGANVHRCAAGDVGRNRGRCRRVSPCGSPGQRPHWRLPALPTPICMHRPRRPRRWPNRGRCAWTRSRTDPRDCAGGTCGGNPRRSACHLAGAAGTGEQRRRDDERRAGSGRQIADRLRGLRYPPAETSGPAQQLGRDIPLAPANDDDPPHGKDPRYWIDVTNRARPRRGAGAQQLHPDRAGPVLSGTRFTGYRGVRCGATAASGAVAAGQGRHHLRGTRPAGALWHKGIVTWVFRTEPECLRCHNTALASTAAAH